MRRAGGPRRTEARRAAACRPPAGESAPAGRKATPGGRYRQSSRPQAQPGQRVHGSRARPGLRRQLGSRTCGGTHPAVLERLVKLVHSPDLRGHGDPPHASFIRVRSPGPRETGFAGSGRRKASASVPEPAGDGRTAIAFAKAYVSRSPAIKAGGVPASRPVFPAADPARRPGKMPDFPRPGNEKFTAPALDSGGGFGI